MKSPRFLRLFVCVLALMIAACGSDSDTDASAGEPDATTAAPTTSTSTTTAAPTTTAVSTTTTAVSTTTVEDGATGSEIDPPEFDPPAEVVEVYSIYGLQFNEDEVACVIESDINLTDSDDLLYGMFLCAPEALAVESAADLVVTGVEGEDLRCATTEAVRAIGLLSRADVLASLEGADYPDLARDDAIARGQDVCGLTEEQMVAVLDSQ